jgi:flagellar export protein FliJ
MKRFNFPLERVRRWRLEQLNIEELKLQQVRAERQALVDAKQQARDDLAQSRQEVLAQSSMLGLELENLDSFGIHVHERIRGIENLEQQSEAKVVEQRGRVLEARRQFELLDGLREKALAKWKAAGDKEQETLAGELFLARSTRNTG